MTKVYVVMAVVSPDGYGEETSIIGVFDSEQKVVDYIRNDIEEDLRERTYLGADARVHSDEIQEGVFITTDDSDVCCMYKAYYVM